MCREVVERRVYTVTGQKASADEVDRMIETGESESIFQKAILEQGRGHVRTPSHLFLLMRLCCSVSMLATIPIKNGVAMMLVVS